MARDEVRSRSWHSGNNLSLLSAIIGCGCVALWALGNEKQVAHMDPIISMALAPQYTQRTKSSHSMHQISNKNFVVPFRRSIKAYGEAEPKSKPIFDMLPVYPSLERVQGGSTIKTYKLPGWADRVQYYLETDGRPLRGSVNLWVGPNRQTHVLNIDNEYGKDNPFSAIVKFNKNVAPVLKLQTSEIVDYPLKFGVYVPNPKRSNELQAYTEKVFDCSGEGDEKQLIQGGSTTGGGGAVRYWVIPSNVASIQLIAWTKDVGRKSFRLDIEVLQGPNRVYQFYNIEYGIDTDGAQGSCQPYHSVIQTPGEGCVIRIKNKKFVSDGHVQVAIVPYEMVEELQIGEGFITASK